MPKNKKSKKMLLKQYFCDLKWNLKNYAIESTGHGFKYIVSEPGIGSKFVWVITRNMTLINLTLILN